MTTEKTTRKSDTTVAAEGNAEVQAKVDEMLDKGYDGETFDPNPNSAYSLLSGPDAPPLAADNKTRVAQPDRKDTTDA